MTIRSLLRRGHEQLCLKSPSARIDAELLLAHALKRPATFLLAHDEAPVGFWAEWRYNRLIQKRRRGVPVAYLTGHREFYGLDFAVNRHVLIPRPDTEILAEAAIDYLRGLKNPLLLDVGTGSGCIPVAALKTLPDLRVVATDVSFWALRVAKKNARRHRVLGRLRFYRSDLLKKVPPALAEGKDLVVTANLPYIPADFELNPETAFEPSLALFGGPDGLTVYKKLLQELQVFKPRAVFLELFEFQIATLQCQWPGYALRRTEKMTGKARLLFLEREA